RRGDGPDFASQRPPFDAAPDTCSFKVAMKPHPLPRRAFLAQTGLWSLAATLLPRRLLAGGETAAPTSTGTPKSAGDRYARLGVRPVINAMGSVTFLGGSLMAPATLAAMEEASQEFVVITE